MCAQPKVVVKIDSEEDMLVLQVSMVLRIILVLHILINIMDTPL